jgi:inorganic pyrophosphatase
MERVNPTHLDNIPAFPKHAKDGGVVHAIIETPRDTRQKYAFEPKYGTFRLTTLLPDGLAWPYDYGFIPQTLADDGDPLDILNMTEVPSFTGCLVECRILGIVKLKKDGVRNDRVIAAPSRLKGVSQPTDTWDDEDDIPAATVEGIIRFLVEYSAEQGHDIVCKGLKSKTVALEAIKTAQTTWNKRQM